MERRTKSGFRNSRFVVASMPLLAAVTSLSCDAEGDFDDPEVAEAQYAVSANANGISNPGFEVEGSCGLGLCECPLLYGDCNNAIAQDWYVWNNNPGDGTETQLVPSDAPAGADLMIHTVVSGYSGGSGLAMAQGTPQAGALRPRENGVLSTWVRVVRGQVGLFAGDAFGVSYAIAYSSFPPTNQWEKLQVHAAPGQVVRTLGIRSVSANGADFFADTTRLTGRPAD